MDAVQRDTKRNLLRWLQRIEAAVFARLYPELSYQKTRCLWSLWQRTAECNECLNCVCLWVVACEIAATCSCGAVHMSDCLFKCLFSGRPFPVVFPSPLLRTERQTDTPQSRAATALWRCSSWTSACHLKGTSTVVVPRGNSRLRHRLFGDLMSYFEPEVLTFPFYNNSARDSWLDNTNSWTVMCNS